jgi:hypothetical protein
MVLPGEEPYYLAMKAADIKSKAGLYILRPRMLGRRSVYKLGQTTNADARLHGTYRTDYPLVADSFELLGFLVTHPDHSRTREAKMLKVALQYGFKKAPHDSEWFTYTGSDIVSDTADLFAAVRAPIDGNFFVFGPAGKIKVKGGRQGINTFGLDHSNVIKPLPAVTTRSAYAKGTRQTNRADPYDPAKRVLRAIRR